MVALRRARKSAFWKGSTMVALLSTLSACSISHRMEELHRLGAEVDVDGAAARAEGTTLDASVCGNRWAGDGKDLRWFGPTRASDRRHLGAWCAAVGPVEYVGQPDAEGSRGRDSRLTVVTWNTHVGGGDVIEFLRSELDYECELARTPRASGPFVLLVQEVFRASDAVPVASEDSRVAGRITGHPPQGPRLDVAQLAHRCGLSLLYVPSMQNGSGVRGEPREDRGSAILSTLPLLDPVAIELPFEAQRRVTVAATVVGPGDRRLRIASVHYDVAGNILRVLGTGGSMRVRQDEGQTEALDLLDPEREVPIVVAGDLNTWSSRETVIQRMLETYPDSPDPGREKTRGDWPPDHLFFRSGAGGWALVEGSYRVIPDEHGSDHRARLAVLTLR
jgi:endonuclease/exonuclease/phosphatase family metal-dependent hydrolase